MNSIDENQVGCLVYFQFTMKLLNVKVDFEHL